MDLTISRHMQPGNSRHAKYYYMYMYSTCSTCSSAKVGMQIVMENSYTYKTTVQVVAWLLHLQHTGSASRVDCADDQELYFKMNTILFKLQISKPIQRYLYLKYCISPLVAPSKGRFAPQNSSNAVMTNTPQL